MVAEFAPAKINLALHVTGRRADGYHLLDSLVVFADVGDRVTVSASDRLSLSVTGPQSGGLSSGPDNLVLRAAGLLAAGRSAAIALEKNLPVSSGIGGGSADAAACLRALARHWNTAMPDAAKVLALGADIPACLAGQPCRMRGVGEQVEPLRRPLPPAWLVLVNPGVALSTPAVFRAMTDRTNAPMPAALPAFGTVGALASFLRQTRNDLEPAATSLAPDIAIARAALGRQPGCLLARMSGSGATCFGLFADAAHAAAAAATLRQAHPLWWAEAAAIRPV